MNNKTETEEKSDDPQQENNEGVASNNNAQRDRHTTFQNPLVIKVLLLYLGVGIITGIGYIAWVNQQVFEIKGDTLVVWNQAVNALLVLVVPFILGCLGAAARILIAGEEIKNYTKVALSSGILAMFSWIGIKSKVFLALLTPYVEKTAPHINEAVGSLEAHNESTFYSLALVAVLVGMFSSNIYLYVNQRVKQLTDT